MRTIVEPKEHIDKLWGKQRIKEDETYRLMKYVLREDYDDHVFLQNAITSKLVMLDEVEKTALNDLPNRYAPCMRQLIQDHFLVPAQFDEHQQVLNLRHVLRTLEKTRSSKTITKFTILPTTACNARCYYCFEQGVKPTTMSEQTADDVVKFISSHCGSKKMVHITWFGGEPTVAAGRIDQISKGLVNQGISFYSDMTTNGYLFNPEMVTKARKLWNLEYLQICFDGLEMHHNSTKSYVNPTDNPYFRTLHNIEMLLNEGIRVGLRMNFDIANHNDFYGLVEETLDRFHGNPGLSVYAFPVIGTYADKTGQVRHGTAEWFKKTIPELNEASREGGTYHERHVLPSLKHHCCDAENDSAITITPSGKLVRCCQCLDDAECVGTIWEGITDADLFLSWKKYADYESCKDCVYFPKCVRIEKCPGGNRCQFFTEWNVRNRRTIIDTYHRKIKVKQ